MVLEKTKEAMAILEETRTKMAALGIAVIGQHVDESRRHEGDYIEIKVTYEGLFKG
jgi:hypothetical protein